MLNMVRSAQRTHPDPVVVRIVDAVAAHEGVDPAELPPLGRVMDTDALNELFDSSGADSCEVRFEFAGHDVSVASDGPVRIDGQPG